MFLFWNNSTIVENIPPSYRCFLIAMVRTNGRTCFTFVQSYVVVVLKSSFLFQLLHCQFDFSPTFSSLDMVLNILHFHILFEYMIFAASWRKMVLFQINSTIGIVGNALFYFEDQLEGRGLGGYLDAITLKPAYSDKLMAYKRILK